MSISSGATPAAALDLSGGGGIAPKIVTALRIETLMTELMKTMPVRMIPPPGGTA